MRRFLFLTVVVIAMNTTLSTAQHHSGDRPSTHGMVVFGKQKIYASHLPMFHSPHHYQVILELELDRKTKNAFVKEQTSRPEIPTYTLVPETFVLPEMLDNPRPFKAMIYRGHFERGGKPVTDSITVSIKKIIFRQKLPALTDDAASYNMIVFGNEAEQFAVHQLGTSPDFEQIMQVGCNESEGKLLIVKAADENKPLGVSGNQIQAVIDKNTITLQLLKQLYLEFNDLK